MLVNTLFRQSIVQSKRESGFSLLELMIALTIISILSALAKPSLSVWVDSSRAKTVRQQLYGLVSEARSIALNQSQTIAICHLNGKKCAPEFQSPISLFSDHNRNAQLDADETLIRVVSMKLPEKIILKWNRSSYMRFWPSGGTGALTGSLSYCNELNPDYDFRLVVARTGRVRIDQDETRCG